MDFCYRRSIIEGVMAQMGKRILFILVSIFGLTVFGIGSEGRGNLAMKISSPEFGNGEFIPAKCSCQGQGINPALFITNIPKEAKSLALIVDDPDAPMGTWVHWVVFNIPITEQIKENSAAGMQGVNSGGDIGYDPMCPPFGTHRYFFKVYALDTLFGLKEGIKKPELENAMKGHILDSAELVGVYKKR